MKSSTKMFIFAAGILTGSLCTWYGTKKEWLARRVEEQDKKAEEHAYELAEKPTSPSVKPNLMEYASMVRDLGYTDYSRRAEEPEKEAKKIEEVDDMDRPYVIEPEEFGGCDYEEVSLTHYADGVLTDEQDNPIEDVDGMVGEDYAEHFGEYEDDSVFVRNDRLHTDFEILADERNYSDLDKNKSYPTEDE